MKNDAMYVGTCLFWTTRNERVAVSQGWALVASETDPIQYCIRRHIVGKVAHFHTHQQAFDHVWERAIMGEATALSALAIIRTGYEEEVEGVTDDRAGLYPEQFCSGAAGGGH